MKQVLEIPTELQVVTQSKYSVPDSNVPFFMVQMPTKDNSVFQFRKSKAFDRELDSDPVSTIMSIENIEHLIELMKAQTEHQRNLSFSNHYFLTENADEFVLYFQLIEKYFYPICLDWKAVHNMQRLQKKTQSLVPELEPEPESITDSENE